MGRKRSEGVIRWPRGREDKKAAVAATRFYARCISQQEICSPVESEDVLKKYTQPAHQLNHRW